MKKLGLIDKIIFFVNTVFALCLLLSLIVPYLSPEQFPTVSVLSLAVSPLLFVNVLFLVFWILRVKKQLLLSLIVLILTIVQFNAFYRLDFGSKSEIKENQLKVMTYNVHMFNLYEWLPGRYIPESISNLIAKDNPDVVSFQEYSENGEVNLKDYPHKYIKLQREKPSFGQAIYSKFPIINEGSLDFENSSNNTIFVDILKDADTIRIYNIHLQSLQIDEKDVDFDQESSKRLIKRISHIFQKQQNQIEQVVAHQKNVSHKTIITADLNNTAFSYVYRKLKSGKNDAFAQAGKGIGKTFIFKKIPLRIDFILTDKRFKVNEFTTYTKQFSDHYPISTLVSWD